MKILLLVFSLVCLCGTAYAANATGIQVLVFDTGPPKNETNEVIVSFEGKYIVRRIDPNTYEPIGIDYTHQSLAWGFASTYIKEDFNQGDFTWITYSYMWSMDSDGDGYSDMMEALYGSNGLDSSAVPHYLFGKKQVNKYGMMITLDATVPDMGGGNTGGGETGGGDTGGGDTGGGDPGDNPGGGDGGGDGGDGGDAPGTGEGNGGSGSGTGGTSVDLGKIESLLTALVSLVSVFIGLFLWRLFILSKSQKNLF